VDNTEEDSFGEDTDSSIEEQELVRSPAKPMETEKTDPVEVRSLSIA
jgi:hypothetical protein